MPRVQRNLLDAFPARKKNMRASSLTVTTAHSLRTHGTYSSYGANNSFSSQPSPRILDSCEAPVHRRLPRDHSKTSGWRRFSSSSPESESDTSGTGASILHDSESDLPNTSGSIEVTPGLTEDSHLKSVN